jgi:hypothetical protein
MKELWEAGEFIRKLRRRMFYGEFSRGHLRLLRLEVRSDCAELNWVARPADVWAANLPPHIRDRDVSLQAVKDAIELRDAFFAALTDVEVAEFKGYRQEGRERPRLIISGTVTRDVPALPRLSSPVMKAKLCGFHFQLDDGVLEPLDSGEGEVQFKVTA